MRDESHLLGQHIAFSSGFSGFYYIGSSPVSNFKDKSHIVYFVSRECTWYGYTELGPAGCRSLGLTKRSMDTDKAACIENSTHQFAQLSGIISVFFSLPRVMAPPIRKQQGFRLNAKKMTAHLQHLSVAHH